MKRKRRRRVELREWRIPARAKFRARWLRSVGTQWIIDCLAAHSNCKHNAAISMRIDPYTLYSEMEKRGINLKKNDLRGGPLAHMSGAELHRLYRINHYNTGPVAELLGVSCWLVRRELHRHGIEVRHGAPRAITWNMDEIAQMYNQGMSLQKIADHYGLASASTVRARLLKHGVRMRPARFNNPVKDAKGRFTKEGGGPEPAARQEALHLDVART